MAADESSAACWWRCWGVLAGGHAASCPSAAVGVCIKASCVVPSHLGSSRSWSPRPDGNGSNARETAPPFKAGEPKRVLWFQRNSAPWGLGKVRLPAPFWIVTPKVVLRHRRVEDKQASLLDTFTLIMMTYKCHCKTSDSAVRGRPSLKCLIL